MGRTLFSAPRDQLRVTKLGAQARHLLALFGEEFDSVQIDAAITHLTANPNRFVGMGSSEFDLDLAPYGQVGGGKETNSTFAEVHAAAVDDCKFS